VIKVSNAKTATVLEVLARTHNIRISVRLLDLDHNLIDDLSDMFVSGQVNFDATADITRSLDLTLFDPFRSVALDPGSPSATGVYIAYMIQIEYVVEDPWNLTPLGLPIEYTIPLFTGPIDDVDREPVYVKIKALGKERLALDNVWKVITYSGTAKKWSVIKHLINEVAGESRAIAGLPTNNNERLGDPLELTRDQRPMAVARKLANELGYQLFFDGRGFPIMRPWPDGNPSFIFKMNHLSGEPTVAYDMARIVNAVEVIGKAPAKGMTAPQYIAVAAPSHPLSPQNLGRAGHPRYLWKKMNVNGRTADAVTKVALQELRDGLLAGVDVKFDGLPIPLLEESDLGRLETDEIAQDFKYKKWSIPLTPDTASYGYLRMSQARAGTKFKYRGRLIRSRKIRTRKKRRR
jgi:hypothetical protein